MTTQRNRHNCVHKTIDKQNKTRTQQEQPREAGNMLFLLCSCFVLFVFCLVYPVVPVFLGCHCCVLVLFCLSFVLCTQCCQEHNKNNYRETGNTGYTRQNTNKTKQEHNKNNYRETGNIVFCLSFVLCTQCCLLLWVVLVVFLLCFVCLLSCVPSCACFSQKTNKTKQEHNKNNYRETGNTGYTRQKTNKTKKEHNNDNPEKQAQLGTLCSCFVLFVFCLVYPMLPPSLGCSCCVLVLFCLSIVLCTQLCL
jgi:Flp pilus assembly protein TadB